MQGHHEGVAWVRGAEPLSAFDVVSTGPRRVIVRVLGGRLAISVHRAGTFRVRWLLDDPQPDYGILTEDGDRPDEGVDDASDVAIEQGTDDGGAWLRLRSRTIALVLRAGPLRLELERDGRVLLGPARDRSIDGDLRFPAVARKDGGWLLSFEPMSSRTTATAVGGCITSTRCSTTAASSRRSTATARARRWCGDVPAGPGASAPRSNEVGTSDATGRDSLHRSVLAGRVA